MHKTTSLRSTPNHKPTIRHSRSLEDQRIPTGLISTQPSKTKSGTKECSGADAADVIAPWSGFGENGFGVVVGEGEFAGAEGGRDEQG